MNSFKLDNDRQIITHSRLIKDTEFRSIITKSFKGKKEWKVRVPNGPGLIITSSAHNDSILQRLNKTYFANEENFDTTDEDNATDVDSDFDEPIDDRLFPTPKSPTLAKDMPEYIDVFSLHKMILELRDQVRELGATIALIQVNSAPMQ
jgi:hypothetical protein